MSPTLAAQEPKDRLPTKWLAPELASCRETGRDGGVGAVGVFIWGDEHKEKLCLYDDPPRHHESGP